MTFNHCVCGHTVDGRNPGMYTWDVQNAVNTGRNYLLPGAGFLPSTVPLANMQDFLMQTPQTIHTQGSHGNRENDGGPLEGP